MAEKRKIKGFSSFLNNPVDFTLVITVLLLLSLGLVMLLSASAPKSMQESADGNSYTYFARQLFFAVAGIIAMLGISRFDYRFFQKFYKLAYVASIVLLIMVLLIGTESHGAKRWINLQHFNHQN